MALTSSTLAPAEVAHLFVEAGIAKHRTRADVVFLKAVRPPSYYSPHPPERFN